MSKFEARIPSYHGDNWESVEGWDHESAAKELGKSYNENCDYTLMNDSVYVLVRRVGSEEVKIVSVSAEPDVYYSATEIDQVNCKHCKKDCRELIQDEGELYDNRFCSRECYHAANEIIRQDYIAKGIIKITEQPK